MSSANSSLRPAWRNQSGGRGFQPPPSVASEPPPSQRGARSQSIGSLSENNNSNNNNDGNNNRSSTYNKFSALDDDEDGMEPSAGEPRPPPPPGSHHHHSSSNHHHHSHHHPPRSGGGGGGGGGNSRSEALRQGLGSRNSGPRPGGRSLADLAAQSPGRFGPARTSTTTTTGSNAASSSASNALSSEESKVVRFTREKLLSMRPAPNSNSGLPEVLKPLEGISILSEEAQDPVCWDTFNAEEIWATVPARRATKTVAGAGGGGGGGGGGRSLTEMAEGSAAVVGVPPRSGGGGSRRDGASSSGRWQRGVALPPPSATDGNNTNKSSSRKGDRDANVDNPNDLWDDPVAGSAAGDFSAFGDSREDGGGGGVGGGDDGGLNNNNSNNNLVAFDFDKMAEQSQLLEEEIHGGAASTRSRASSVSASVGKEDASYNSGMENSNGGTTIPAAPEVVSKTVDAHRPLASTGTTIRSGSGDHVNVFEDFDEPMSSDSTPTAVDPMSGMVNQNGKVAAENPPKAESIAEPNKESAAPPKNNSIPGMTEDMDATSRLMAMIGVSNAPPKPDPVPLADPTTSIASEPEPPTVEPIGVDPQRSRSLSSPWGLMQQPEVPKPLDGLTIPLNPWGVGTLIPPTPAPDLMAGGHHHHHHHHGGPSLLQPEAAALKELELQARLREADFEQKAREQQEELARQQRRRQEEFEAQKRAAELQQQQQQAAAAAARQQQQQRQQQQAPGVQSQVELVLMERISIILENSWGRSDLMSILATLHAEDTRVIPLLNSIEALRALIARNSSRVALRHDPAFGAEMAVLLVTNAQWQQQQRQQQQQQQEALARARRQQEEEMRRREQQQRMLEEEQAASEALRKQKEQQDAKPVIVPGAPWYYSDPQQNIQGPFRGEEMRQWYDAGYFKGDLPVSQSPTGPFRLLSDLYPNLDLAFMHQGAASQPQQQNNQHLHQQQQQLQEEEDDALDEEVQLRAQQQQLGREAVRARALAEAEEQERLAREAAAAQEKAAREAAEAAERERRASQRQQQISVHHRNAEESHESSDGGNESSAQLKMMLGLSAQQQQHDLQEDGNDQKQREHAPAPKGSKTKSKKSSSAKTAHQANSVVPAPPSHELSPQQNSSPNLPKPAASAWGVSSNPKQVSRKSMSEIQQEEARLAALQAMQRERSGVPGGSSGWANVAATKTTPTVVPAGGWTGSAAAKLAPAVGVATKDPAIVINSGMPKPTQVLRKQSAPASTSRAQIANVAAINAASAKQHHASGSTTAGDEFGAKMSPALEKWCKEQMMKLNGTDDLTLVSFCMTLNDPNEIRQYLVTYLGSSPQVNNFANEFIYRKVGAKPAKAEEWETTVSNKKKSKKKTTTAGGR